LGAARHRLADAAHSDDAETLAPNAMAEHPGRAPTAPFAIAGKHLGALGQPARHSEDQRHGHVGSILGEHAGRIGHGNAALHGGRNIDVVDAVAEIGDQLQAFAGLAEHRPVDVIGDGRDQHIGGFHRFDELRLAHRLVVVIEAGVEQFAHAHFDAVRQPAGDHDQRLLARRHTLPLPPGVGLSASKSKWLQGHSAPPPVQVSLTPLADTKAPGGGFH